MKNTRFERMISVQDQHDLLQRDKGSYKTKLTGKKIWKKSNAKLKNNLSTIWACWNLQREELANLTWWKKTLSRVTRSDNENRGSISHNTFNGLKDISRS